MGDKSISQIEDNTRSSSSYDDKIRPGINPTSDRPGAEPGWNIGTTALVVPTLNAGSSFSRWLHILKGQTYQPDRLMLIDSSSNDGTTDLALHAGFEIVTIGRDEFSHGGSRQLAVELLRDTEIIIFITQDAILAAPESLANLLRKFTNPVIGASYGRQLPRKNSGLIEAHARMFNYPEISQVRGFHDASIYGIKTSFISNSFAAWRRAALMESGGFPINVIQNEDTCAASLIINNGWKVVYCADAPVFHSHGYSYRKEFGRYFDIGVFHSQNPFIRRMFGKAEGEGLKFIKSEFEYLIRNNPFLLPSAFIRNLLKYAGFRLGLSESRLSLKIKLPLSSNKVYWHKNKLNDLPHIVGYKSRSAKKGIESKKGNNCVIFGGAGYIGTKLAGHFLETGRFDNIHIADIRPTPLEGRPGITSSYTDVRRAVPSDICKGRVEWIFNLAAVHREPGHYQEEYFRTNIPGARNVCEYAEKTKCRNIYFTSTVSVYGPAPAPADEARIPVPSTPYGSSKLAAELIHESWYNAGKNRRLLISRPGVIYGPGDPGNIMRMIKAIDKGYFAYPGSPGIYKSYGYIYGLIDSIDFLMKSDIDFIYYNYVETPTQPLFELVDEIKSYFNSRAVVIPISRFLLGPFARLIHIVMGTNNPIHPVRVSKAATPTHIIPRRLLDLGFQFKYDFRKSLEHWQAMSPRDFAFTGKSRKLKPRKLVLKRGPEKIIIPDEKIPDRMIKIRSDHKAAQV